MIGDDGVARLDTQSGGDIDNYRYSAPEALFPWDYGGDVTPYSYARDIYGIGMITYEASSHHPAQPKTLPYSRS